MGRQGQRWPPGGPRNGTKLPLSDGAPRTFRRSKKALVEGRAILWADASGFYLLPALLCTGRRRPKPQAVLTFGVIIRGMANLELTS